MGKLNGLKILINKIEIIVALSQNLVILETFFFLIFISFIMKYFTL